MLTYLLRHRYVVRLWLLTVAGTLLQVQPCASQEIHSSDLIQRLNWVRFELVRGRIISRDTRQGQSRSATVTNAKQKSREEVTLKIVGGNPLFAYQYQDEKQKIQIELVNHNRLLIKRTPAAETNWTRVAFHQSEQGTISLVITEDQDSVTYVANHLWQLILKHPDPCRQHLYPLLKLLRADWQLDQWSEQVETNLVRLASFDAHPEYGQLQELIEQLSHPQFRRRQSADRQLRAMGQPVASYLSQLNTDRMTSEQRLRIRRICQSLNTRGGDTPEGVTAWLLSSPRIWFIFMSRPDHDVRSIAYQQLVRLVQRKVVFNPAADPRERQLQLGRIESTIFSR